MQPSNRRSTLGCSRLLLPVKTTYSFFFSLTFKDDADLAIRERHQHVGHVGIPSGRNIAPAEGISTSGIETGGHNHHVWVELVFDFFDFFFIFFFFAVRNGLVMLFLTSRQMGMITVSKALR